MQEYTPYQEGILRQYYANLDAIMLQKLQELVGDLYLAQTPSRRKLLWGRVEKALTNLQVPPSIAGHILEKKSAETLARHVASWLDNVPKAPKPDGGRGPARKGRVLPDCEGGAGF